MQIKESRCSVCVCVSAEISAIKLAHEQQVALKRRRATPVVGDMRSLADALPELSHIIESAASRKPRR